MHGIAGVVAESGWRDRTSVIRRSHNNRSWAVVQLRGAHQRIGCIRQVRGISAIRHRIKIKRVHRKIECLAGSSRRKQGLVGGEQPDIAAKDMPAGFFPNTLSSFDSPQGGIGSALSVVLGCGNVENAPVIDGAELVFVLVSRLSLQRLCCIQPRRAGFIDDPLRQQIPHRLPRVGRDIGSEDIVEAAIFADHDNQMFDRGEGERSRLFDGLEVWASAVAIGVSTSTVMAPSAPPNPTITASTASDFNTFLILLMNAFPILNPNRCKQFPSGTRKVPVESATIRPGESLRSPASNTLTDHQTNVCGRSVTV